CSQSGSHPDVEQLTLPIHRPEDQVVLGETSLSFALSVAHSRIERLGRMFRRSGRLLLTSGCLWLTLYLPRT
ncbi:hypothetical protein Tco_0434072, partial [Tanacetum coccineum]